MRKDDFMKQENVPGIIKHILSDIPEHAEIDFSKLEIREALGGCKCKELHKNHTDDVNIKPFLETFCTQLTELLDIADDDGYISQKDHSTATAVSDLLMCSTLSLSGYLTKSKSLCKCNQKPAAWGDGK